MCHDIQKINELISEKIKKCFIKKLLKIYNFTMSFNLKKISLLIFSALRL